MGNLSFQTQWQDLKDHMRQMGDVVRADVITAPDGRSKGFGIVVYAAPHEAEAAIQQVRGADDKAAAWRGAHPSQYTLRKPLSRHLPTILRPPCDLILLPLTSF